MNRSVVGRARLCDLKIRTYRPGDETTIVGLLNDAHPRGWGNIARWQSKHANRPGFEARHVYLAEVEGEVIGCLHCAVFPVRLGPGVAVPASIDGDLAVRRDWRGRGVAEKMYAVSSESLLADGIVLRLGYSGGGSRLEFYTRVLGYVTGFENLRAYRKLLDATILRDRLLASLNCSPNSPDPGRGPLVELAVTGIGPLRLRLGETISCVEDSTERASLRLETDQRLLGHFGESGRRRREFLSLILRGAVRLRTTPAGALRVSMWFMRFGWRKLRRRRAGIPVSS